MPYHGPTYAEYLRALQAAEDALSESIRLRRRIGDLEQRLQAVELVPQRISDLGSADLTRLAHHHHALVTVITEELRARHCDVAEELISPQIRALEERLAAAKERAWDARQRARDLEQENARLMATLEKLADVADVRPEHEHVHQRGGAA
jgi:hypothetical protein